MLECRLLDKLLDRIFDKDEYSSNNLLNSGSPNIDTAHFIFYAVVNVMVINIVSWLINIVLFSFMPSFDVAFLHR